MKRIVEVLMIAALTLSVTACSSMSQEMTIGTSIEQSKTEENQTIDVWCWDAAFNVYAMEEAAKIYEAAHPEVSINVVETAWVDIQERLTTAVVSGQEELLPEILLIQDSALAKNIMAYPGVFADLTDSEINFKDFASFKTQLGNIEGKQYSVPFDNGTAITGVRTDIIAEAGFTVEDFTDITWSEFIEKGKVVREKTGKPMLTSQMNSPDLVLLMLQSTGNWLLQGNEPYFTQNKALKRAVEVYIELVKTGVLEETNDWNNYLKTIQTSSVAGVMNGCWITGTLNANEDQKGLWEITNIPKLDGIEGATNYSSQGGASWLVVESASQKDLAIEFLKDTFGSSVALYETILPSSGALASYIPAGKSNVYAKEHEFFNNQKVYEMITNYATKVPQVTYGVYNNEARNRVGAAITKIVNNGMDMDVALKEAEVLFKQDLQE